MSLIEKVRRLAQRVVREQPTVDPAVFNDPLAMKTQWTPLSPGGASFRTHRLVAIDEGSLAMKKSLGSFLFGGLFFVVGLGLGIVGAVESNWVSGLVGAIFTGVGALVAWPTSLVFDANRRSVLVASEPVAFSNIHAVQIVKEYVRGNKRSFWSYELNLVLKDGERRHVVDHGDLDRIRGDSHRISALVACKVWDATLPRQASAFPLA